MGVGHTRGITVIAAPGAAAAAVMPGVRSTPGLPRGGDARGAARGQLDLGEISAKPHLYERCMSVSVALPAELGGEKMPFVPASLSWALVTTMGSRPAGPYDRPSDRYTTVTPCTPGRDGHTPGHAGAGDARGATHPGPAAWQ